MGISRSGSAHQMFLNERAKLDELGARGVDVLVLSHAVHDVQCALDARAEFLLERRQSPPDRRLCLERSRVAARARVRSQ